MEMLVTELNVPAIVSWITVIPENNYANLYHLAYHPLLFISPVNVNSSAV